MTNDGVETEVSRPTMSELNRRASALPVAEPPPMLKLLPRDLQFAKAYLVTGGVQSAMQKLAPAMKPEVAKRMGMRYMKKPQVKEAIAFLATQTEDPTLTAGAMAAELDRPAEYLDDDMLANDAIADYKASRKPGVDLKTRMAARDAVMKATGLTGARKSDRAATADQLLEQLDKLTNEETFDVDWEVLADALPDETATDTPEPEETELVIA